jgi:hypothetical protein
MNGCPHRCLFALALLLLADCGHASKRADRSPIETTSNLELGKYVCAPQRHELPCQAGVTQGRPYAYVLPTHCGIREGRFDGRLWKAVDSGLSRTGNPPRGWANPYQRGTMQLSSEQRAEFRAGPLRATFKPAPANYKVEPCE